MPNEFDNIQDLAGWRAKLDELLQAAKIAASNNALDPRIAMTERLTDFIVNNPPSLADRPETAEYATMDEIAGRAIDDLMLTTIEQRVGAIVSRTAELAGLRKQFDQQAEINTQTASALRLTKSRRVVESTTDVVSAMKDLRTELKKTDDADDAELAKKIEALIKRIQNLRNDIEDVA